MKKIAFAIIIAGFAIVANSTTVYPYEPWEVTTSYPDINKQAPDWSRPIKVLIDYNIIQHIMNIKFTMFVPNVRIWKNLSNDDKKICLSCDGTFDIIVGKEIWLRDNATLDDMMDEIILYYQIYHNGYNDLFLDSEQAKSERVLIKTRWKAVQRTHNILER